MYDNNKMAGQLDYYNTSNAFKYSNIPDGKGVTASTINISFFNSLLPLSDNETITEENPWEPNFINVVGIWITGTFCLLGFIGNVLSFLVLVKAFAKSPMFFVLRAVAISDAIFLLGMFIMQTLVHMYPFTGMFKWCFVNRGYIMFALWPILMITQMSTVWLTILVSIERYIAICYPLKANYLCTLRNLRLSVAFICISCVLYNIPRYFEHTIYSPDTIAKSEIVENEVYRYLYMCALYTLALFLLPLALLIVLNAKLVYALQKGKKEWQKLKSRQKREQTLTIIPLTIVLVFFVCGTPALVVNIVESMNPDIQSLGFIQFLVLANLLVVLNSACNFIIYCFLGKRFRSKLLELCGCGTFRGSYQVVHQLVHQQSQMSHV